MNFVPRCGGLSVPHFVLVCEIGVSLQSAIFFFMRITQILVSQVSQFFNAKDKQVELKHSDSLFLINESCF